MRMTLRKRQPGPSEQPLAPKHTKTDTSHQTVGKETQKINRSHLSVNNQIEEEKCESTIFDSLVSDCMDEVLNWLPLSSVCSFSKTCESLQKICKNYFKRKYQSQEFTIGDEFIFDKRDWNCFGDIVLNLRLYDSTIDDFAFAGSNANRKLREIAFDRTFKEENEIGHEHIDQIQNLLENVKTVRAVDCDFSDGDTNYLLEKCRNIVDFAFKIPKNLAKDQLHFRKYPTLRNIELHFHPKANVVEALRIIQEENSNLDELVLLFSKEHNFAMESVFNELNAMHDNGFFKRLYLMFDNKSMVTEHIGRLTSMRGLEGLTCSYTINRSIDMADIAKLQNLKFLNISWLLDNADQIAKELQQLDELEVTVASIDAIVSFVRFSGKLTRFHLEQIRENKEKRSKFDASVLNKERMELEYARKLMIYIPEQKFIKLKWASVDMDSMLVEFKREESCIPLKKSNTSSSCQ